MDSQEIREDEDVKMEGMGGRIQRKEGGKSNGKRARIGLTKK